MTQQPQKKPLVVAGLVGLLLLLVGGVLYSLAQVQPEHRGNSLAEQINAENAKDPQLQRLKKKAGIKD